MFFRLWVATESRLRGESGASLVEYALLVALIAIVAIVTIELVGTKVDDSFQSVADNLPGG